MKTPPTKPIRIMLVDDHTMVRQGLATFLKVFKDLQRVGEAEKQPLRGLSPGIVF